MQWYAACLFVGTAPLLMTVSAAPAPSSAPPQLARQAITEFARCVAKRHPREAADYVLRKNTPISATIWAERRLADRVCVPGGSNRDDAKALLKLPAELRAVLAEVLVREEFPTFDASLINAAQPLGYANLVESLWPADACKKCKPDRLKEFEEMRAKASALMAPLVFGECAVRTDPANAHRLLMTEADSAEETSALRALGVAFAQCVSGGIKFTTTRKVVREALALNYYRLAHAPRVQTAAGATR